MIDFQFMLELIFMGICVGSVYSLIAHGFNITFWTTKVVNFAHGPFLMFCSMLILMFLSIGFPWIVAILLEMFSISIIGVILERVSVRPLVKSPTSMGWIVATLGVGLFLQALATKIWGAQALAFPAFIFESTDYVPILGISMSLQYLLVLGTGLGIMLIMELVMKKTIWGKAMKAVSFDPDLASVMGIKSKSVVTISFILSALLAGVAGLLIAPIYGNVAPDFGMNIMVLGFVAAVLGGMGSSKGALIGGMTLGVIEKLVGGYISTSAEHGVAFAILILILAIKPEGLFGIKAVQKV
ncbi:branched-chain amino acid ABC transporter permease [Jeotgalibacillus soli]|uniref:Branched-chain amino acid ABC transporter permease n=1 Tax=Jeotgalibacillus soli TaxID=889306 RepID=A0A0C2RUI5_9BACL|nr:branched-chain amino acid ABC transporter permease [Jeotgalibacillus soli]KIL45404.1 branched-chain amino acid ABC transporter permease [Jeotgalibacillus soli]